MDWSVDVTVLRCRRGVNSPSANPAYWLDTDKGPYRTATDTAAAYGLENDFPVQTSMEKPATLHLSQGRVIGYEVKEKEDGS
jgi:hypothetical protein